MTEPRSIAWLDSLSADECAATLAPLFEGAPAFLDRLVGVRPFGDAGTLFARARAIAHALTEDEQVELIDAHPRLGAPPGSVSVLSFQEQGYGEEAADAATATAEDERARVAAELARLNDAYEARYGFRYCVFVAGRPRAALLPDFRAAVQGTADAASERHRALDAVVDIAIDRHGKLTAR